MPVAWRWLTEPTGKLTEPERRRSKVLATLVLMLLLSAGGFLIAVIATDFSDLRAPYILLISGLIGIFAIAFGLNRAGYFQAAAGLMIACTVLGPWVSILLNLDSLASDHLRLTYIAVSILLSSFLLSTWVTVFVAASQLAILAVVLLGNPVLNRYDWSSLLGYLIFISLLSIVSNFISRWDLAQIHRQTLQLRESEALLRELSIRDPLTGLFNRRYLDETLERELKRAARKHLPLGVIMLDIDHFKLFNDTHGHAAGDLLLQQLGDTLKRHIRAGDIACRYGGEEFLLILPEANREVSLHRAEHLREEVKRIRIHHENQDLDGVTMSLGVAGFPQDGKTCERVLKAVDDALYQAKREGRDRVIAAGGATVPRTARVRTG